MGVAVALAQLVGPKNRGVVEERSVAIRIGRCREFLSQRGDFAGEPAVDLHQFFLRTGVEIGIVRERVMAVIDTQPAHAGLPDRVGVLQGGHSCHVIGEGIDQQVGLHARNLGNGVVLIADARF